MSHEMKLNASYLKKVTVPTALLKPVRLSLDMAQKTYPSKSTTAAGMDPRAVFVTLNLSVKYFAMLWRLIGSAGRRNLSRAAMILDLYSLSEPQITISL